MFILVTCEAHLSSILIMLVCALDTSISKLQLLRIYEPLWAKACFGSLDTSTCTNQIVQKVTRDLETRAIQPKCAHFSFHICQNK